MRNLRAKIPYIILQGAFLPLLLRVDDYFASGQMMMAWLLFGLYEILIMVDAIIYWLIFERSRR